MPYIYTCAYETSQGFVPMMRPMFYAFPEDSVAAKEQYQFMFGDSILVAPVTEKGARTKRVWLPEGIWYDFHTGKKYTGGKCAEVFAPLDTLPLFVRGGSLIPMAEEMLHTDAQRLDKLILHIYPGSDGSFHLYEDDGYTCAYEKGQWAKTGFAYKDAEKLLTVAATEGGYAGMPWARSYEVVCHDADKPEGILVNGAAETAWSYDARSRLLKVTLEQMPVKEHFVIQLITGEAMETGIALQEASLRYDLEYLPEMENARMSCLIRIFGENDDRVSLTIPVGWTCVSQKQEILATGQTVSIFLLQMEGREFTSTGTVTLKLRRGEKLLWDTVNLLSGWVTWWKLAGAYRYGPEGFDTEFLPEKQLCIDEKNLEFDYALNGIVGLETSLALSITYLVKTGKMTLAEMLKKMTYNPSNILNLGLGEIALGAIADLTIFDPDEIWTVEVDKFHSKSKNSPYDGYTLSGKAHVTIVEGKVMYEN